MAIIQSEATVAIPTHLTVPEFVLRTDNLLNPREKRLDLCSFINPVTQQQITHRELRCQVGRVAGALYNGYGVRRGDTIGIVCPNHVNYATVLLAGLTLGAIVTTLNPNYTKSELVKLLDQVESLKLIFCTRGEYELVSRSLKSMERFSTARPAVLSMDNQDGGIFDMVTFDSLLLAGETKPYTPLRFNDHLKCDEVPGLLIFSSGTTGAPKGVLLSHHNLIANLVQSEYGCRSLEITGRISLGLLPFFHCFGIMMLLLHNLHSCMTVIVLPSFDWETLLSSIERYKIESLCLVPPIMSLLANDKRVDRYDLTSVKVIICGAAPLPEATHVMVKERLGCDVIQAYGMSEASPGITMQQFGSQVVVGSLGELMPNIQAKIVDIDSMEVVKELSRTGELWIKGPNTMMGYLNNEEATVAMFDGEGFMRTGDIGYFSRNEGSGGGGGCEFYIVDRAKELIKYKGFQIAPTELEGVLLSHSYVKDCCVIGTAYHQELEEVPAALVVLDPAMTPKVEPQVVLDAITSHTNERVVDYKRLRGGIRLVTEIPRSATGKILRRVAKQRFNLVNKI